MSRLFASKSTEGKRKAMDFLKDGLEKLTETQEIKKEANVTWRRLQGKKSLVY